MPERASRPCIMSSQDAFPGRHVDLNEHGAPVVTMSCLGRIGRFGNQFFQYTFLRHYARRHGLAVQTPAWIGQELFGCADPPIARSLPVIYEPGWDVQSALMTRPHPAMQNVDLWGYFLLPTSFYAPERDWLRGLFRPVGERAETVQAAAAGLRARGKTVIALHVRLGDKYADGRFVFTPLTAYADWLRERWAGWPSPVLFIASDDPSVAGEFAEFQPVLAGDLGSTDPEFYLDFFLLTQADVLLISNSTFSFAAAMLNERATQFVRPVPELGELVDFDPWDAEPLLRDKPNSPRDYYADVLARAAAATDESAYRSVRAEIAGNWLGCWRESMFPIVFFWGLGEAHRLCMRSPLRGIPLDDADRRLRDSLLATLEDAVPPAFFAAYLLAATLYCSPEEIRAPVDLAALPQFIREDLLAFFAGRAG